MKLSSFIRNLVITLTLVVMAIGVNIPNFEVPTAKADWSAACGAFPWGYIPCENNSSDYDDDNNGHEVGNPTKPEESDWCTWFYDDNGKAIGCLEEKDKGGGSNHTVIDRNVNVTIDTNGLTTGSTAGKDSNSKDNTGNGLGEIVTHETAKPFNLYFSNIAKSSTVTTGPTGFLFEIVTEKDNTIINLPVKSSKTGNSESQLNKTKAKFDSLFNNITFHLYDLNKVSTVPDDITSLVSSNEGKVTEFILGTKESLTENKWLKIKDSGYYALVAVADIKTENPKVQKVGITFKLDELGQYHALPIQNRLTAFTENRNLMEGKLNNVHELNLMFGNAESMKVPAVYDSQTKQYLVGSLNGGLKLFNQNMETIELNNQSLADTINVSQIVEVSKHKFLVSTLNSGVFMVDTNTKDFTKFEGVKDTKNNSMVNCDLIIITTDNDLKVYKFQPKSGELTLRKSITSKEIFASDVKLGEVNRVGDKLIVNSLYDQGQGKVALISL